MATQKPKSGGSRVLPKESQSTKSSGAKASTSTKSSASTKSNTSTKSSTSTKSTAKKAPTAPENNNRPVWERISAGIICFLLAMFLVLSMCGIEALFISFLAGAIKGFFGYGFWLALPCLLCASFVFFFRLKKPIAQRLWSLALLPLFFGAILHTLFNGTVYAFSLTGMKELWVDGQLLQSGGLISGLIATAFSQLFSKIGAGIIFFFAFLVFFLMAMHLTPSKMLGYYKSGRERKASRVSYEDDEDYEEGEQLSMEDMEEESPSFFAKLKSIHRNKQKKKKSAPTPAPVPIGSDAPQNPVPPTPLKPPAVKAPSPLSLGKETREPVGGADSTLEASTATNPNPVATPTPMATTTAPVSTATPTPAPMPMASAVEDSLEEEKELSRKEEKAVIRENQVAVAKEVALSLESTVGQAYEFPPEKLLHEIVKPVPGKEEEELRATSQRLGETIKSFGIVAKITGAVRGPSVTRYELELEQGVRLNKLTNLADDIALALGAASVRIAPVAGKISLVGVEVPNQQISPVVIREVLTSSNFTDSTSKVSFAVGKDIGGNCIVGDIAKLPHLLVAGTTGSGKSVCTNSLIISMLYKSTPDEVRLIMVDPKMVELSIYNGIPHLLIPVVTDPKKAAGALQWAVVEMMKRYRLFSEVGVRDLASYNELVGRDDESKKMPQIVVVIDELADLMLVAAKEVEESICRVAQMGRASGMHLIIATQRPSADVITGLMKANIPSRIAFAVASSLESRIILDTQGAEKLVGKGDMLWAPLGAGKPLRVQGCLISDSDVAAVVDFVKQRGDSSYDEAVLREIEQHAAQQGSKGKKAMDSEEKRNGESDFDQDPLFNDAVEIVLELGQGSTSMIQRRLKIGYSRAGRLMDQMETYGIVGGAEGSKPRQLLITREQWAKVLAKKAGYVEEESTIEIPEPEVDELTFADISDAVPWEEDDVPPSFGDEDVPF